MASYRTLPETSRHEAAKVKGSRFIVSMAPVSTLEEVQEFIASCRREFHAATHHCYAWRLGLGEESFRYSDDGEPNGTAGKPILQEIDARDLTDLVLVVTRYFGGTKLGTGGLLRAYANAASSALDASEIKVVPILRSLRVVHGYEQTAAVERVLHAYKLRPSNGVYGVDVELHLKVPVEALEQLRNDLQNATAGKISIEPID